MAYLYSPMRKYPSSGSRIEDGILTSEMSYTDYNTLPVGANVDTKLDDFSYTFLPPDKWYPIPPHPPICVAEKVCPVCPSTTNVNPRSLSLLIAFARLSNKGLLSGSNLAESNSNWMDKSTVGFSLASGVRLRMPRVRNGGELGSSFWINSSDVADRIGA
jgi:hypothetical protein